MLVHRPFAFISNLQGRPIPPTPTPAARLKRYTCRYAYGLIMETFDEVRGRWKNESMDGEIA
jgi:hypothetical protein